MKAKINNGKVFTGKLAKILISKGIAKKIEKRKTANEVSELIANCNTIEQLKQYETDTRQIVVNAYKKKLKEFE